MYIIHNALIIFGHVLACTVALAVLADRRPFVTHFRPQTWKSPD